MNWQQLLVGVYERTAREVEAVLGGLTAEDLHRRPSPGANPIGWLCWHATRSMDRTLGDIVLGEQLWVRDGWHRRFGMPADPLNTGYGHTDAQVDGLRTPDAATLLAYHRAVMAVTLDWLARLTEEELSRDYPFSALPGATRPLYLRLIANIHDIQHVGQASYVRGLVKGHRWAGV